MISGDSELPTRGCQGGLSLSRHAAFYAQRREEDSKNYAKRFAVLAVDFRLLSLSLVGPKRLAARRTQWLPHARDPLK